MSRVPTNYKRIKRRIWKSQDGLCFACAGIMSKKDKHKDGKDNPKYATLDHWIPRSMLKAQGVNPNGANLVLMHRSCNQVKNNDLPTEGKPVPLLQRLPRDGPWQMTTQGNWMWAGTD